MLNIDNKSIKQYGIFISYIHFLKIKYSNQ